ncbi:Heat shock factor binding protein 1 [Novymonas esmeraldas]|uniref:Heat shock factor binding protein 1 n=1 Tax=Novymonas esmeraldas TaxID=1808958 RepID=A0AAW0ERC5_9TRYP
MPPKTATSPAGRTKSADVPPASSPSASIGAGSVPQGGTQELTSYVQGLLQQMQARFEEMSSNIISRIDEMGARIDDLEHSIDELMQQSGVEDGDTAVARPKK